MLVVWKLDRLGRNLAHLVNTVQNLSVRGVGLRVLTGQGAQIDTTTAAGRLVFGIFAALAEFERELIPARGHDAGVAMFEAVGSGKTAACMPPFAPHRRRTPLSGSPCPEGTIAPERPHRRGGRRATSPRRRGQASTILGGGSLRALWKVYPSRPGGDAAREHALAPA